MKRFAVVVTHDRPEDYRDCLAAILPQVHTVIVVSHNAAYVEESDRVWKIDWEAKLPNISRMWNLGIMAAESMSKSGDYYIAVLNDDAIVPEDWFDRVVRGMDRKGAALGCVARLFDPRPAGYAFILDGRLALMADEQFQWWYGDDDLVRRAERMYGIAQVAGVDVEHRHPNSTTVGELADIAAADGERFKRKWSV